MLLNNFLGLSIGLPTDAVTQLVCLLPAQGFRISSFPDLAKEG